MEKVDHGKDEVGLTQLAVPSSDHTMTEHPPQDVPETNLAEEEDEESDEYDIQVSTGTKLIPRQRHFVTRDANLTSSNFRRKMTMKLVGLKMITKMRTRMKTEMKRLGDKAG